MFDVRPMRADDLGWIADLSSQLGYPVEAPDLERRFRTLIGDPNHGLFIPDGRRAWVHVYGVSLLESDGYAEIGGLVVDKGEVREGIGSALMRAAECWAEERGFGRVRLGSGRHRSAAHAFYKAIGYEKTEPPMFQKRLK